MNRLLVAPKPWLKICGITRPEDAALAVELGATLLGINFWNQSSRCVALDRAREIVAAVAGRTPIAGVFVNEDPDRIDEVVATTGIDLIQLHGDEPPEVVDRFAPKAIRALRLGSQNRSAGEQESSALRSAAEPPWPSWEAFQPAGSGSPTLAQPLAFLLDGPAGARYGGTGAAWNWSLAREVVALVRQPVLIAGGIRPENVREALRVSGATGVDVASGVESAPGIKDPEKMTRMFEELRHVAP